MKAYIVTDLGFGDSGKGTITSALCRKHNADLCVRYNGGAQAAHTVISNGIKHTFHNYGSGTLEGVPTQLSQHVLIDPVSICYEAIELASKGVDLKSGMLYLDPRSILVTTYHKYLNRALEEDRGANKHGSCGMGIGTTRMIGYPLTVELALTTDITSDLKQIRDICIEHCPDNMKKKYLPLFNDPNELQAQVDVFRDVISESIIMKTEEHLKASNVVVFEGAQGVLLDEKFGLDPYNTWSNTTKHNAMELLEGITKDIHNVGVLRTYQTRHGAGPLPTETSDLDYLNEVDNPTNQWQGHFRFGYLDLVLLEYAIKCNNGIDSYALTCIDQLEDYDLKLAIGASSKESALYPWKGKRKLIEYSSFESFREAIANFIGKPESICSYGPETEKKIFWT